MSGCTQDREARSLSRLRQRLELYAVTIEDWQQALDEASAEIAGLTAAEATEAADEIHQIETSRAELAALRKQVDAGWALYHRLSEKASRTPSAAPAVALPPSLEPLH